MEPFPKLLGITFDPKLSFIQHFKIITNKATAKINILRILKNKIKNNTNFIINVYKIIVRSIFDYSHLAITSINSQNSTMIQKIQNKCLRICINPPLLTSTANLHSIVNIQTIHTRAKILTDSYLRKAELENTLIKFIISEYKINSELHEGSQLIGRKPHKTILFDSFKST
jgi:hypothetical protein